MSLQADKLCTTFHAQAAWTQDMIGKGLSFRLGLLEETLTDIHLIQIAMAHDGYVVTRKFTRREEGAASGADWLWCIGGPGAWLSLLVQAKIVNPQTGKCRYLHYKHGEQRRRLLTFARRHRLLPLYCIYGLVDAPLVPVKPIVPAAPNEPEQWSCAMVSPRTVKRMALRRSRAHEDLLEFGLPWKMLFCGARSASALAPTVAEAWNVLRRGSRRPQSNSRDQAATSERGGSRPRRIQWDDVEPEILITEELPSLVLALLDPKMERAPIGGVSLISSIPVAELSNRVRLLEPGRQERPEWWEISLARWRETL